MPAPAPCQDPCRRRLPLPAILVAALLFAAAPACSSPEPESASDLEAVSLRPPEVFRLPSGPLQEVRIGRDTDGRFVVSGVCYFPDGTQVTVALRDSLGTSVARTRPTVANGLFDALPLGAAPAQPLPRGRYEIEISAFFGPDDQPAEVLQETEDGRALTGHGMFTTERGNPAFRTRFPVEP